MRSQCTCSDCARSEGNISKVGGEYIPVYVDEYGCTYLDVEEAGEDAGDLDEAFQCDSCGSVHFEAGDAEECCGKWECNFCGWVSIYQEDAASCCVIECDECSSSGWPDYMSDHECGKNGTMRRQLPWEARGVVVDGRFPDTGTKWKQTWALEPEQHNVVRAAADYYLLEAMKSGLVGTVDAETTTVFSEERLMDVELVHANALVANHTLMRIVRNEAQERFDALVDTWDPILVAYTHIAVGGELRHHTAVGGEVLDSNRDRAWSGWKTIFEAVGPDALTDAAELFREFTGGSFGGDPWAQACEILHKRLTGQIDRALFLDRIFNAQHNGGCLLNKVSWAGDQARHCVGGTTPTDSMSVDELTYQVLPAHGAEPEPDYSTLLAYASKEVRALFADCHEMGRRARLDLGMSLAGIPVKPSTGETKYSERNRQQVKLAAKAAFEASQPQSYKYLKAANDYQKSADAYFGYAHGELKHYEAKVTEAVTIALAGGVPLGVCGVKGCHSCPIGGDYKYFRKTAKQYQSDADAYKVKYEEALAAEAKGAGYVDSALGALLAEDEYYPDVYDDEPCECCR